MRKIFGDRAHHPHHVVHVGVDVEVCLPVLLGGLQVADHKLPRVLRRTGVKTASENLIPMSLHDTSWCMWACCQLVWSAVWNPSQYWGRPWYCKRTEYVFMYYLLSNTSHILSWQQLTCGSRWGWDQCRAARAPSPERSPAVVLGTAFHYYEPVRVKFNLFSS